MTEHQTIDLDRGEPHGKAVTPTPSDHELTIRDERFCRKDRPPRWWHSNDPVATAWYNSVSASLPRGEAFFIDTLREFRDQLPQELTEEVKTFIRQEINHTREHVAFNRLVSDHGYNVESIDKGIAEMLALAADKPKEVNLAISIALEHFAACISDRLLSDPRYLEGAHPEAAAMWRWHATEEIDHKGLVADVWDAVTRDWSAWRRYKTRTLVALLITRKYFRNRRRDAIGLLAQDGITGWQAKWRLHKLLWLSPGMMSRMFFQWARILLPGFHPWKHDNRALLENAESHYSRGPLPAE